MATRITEGPLYEALKQKYNREGGAPLVQWTDGMYRAVDRGKAFVKTVGGFGFDTMYRDVSMARPDAVTRSEAGPEAVDSQSGIAKKPVAAPPEED